jgi:hypothetical protein
MSLTTPRTGNLNTDVSQIKDRGLRAVYREYLNLKGQDPEDLDLGIGSSTGGLMEPSAGSSLRTAGSPLENPAVMRQYNPTPRIEQPFNTELRQIQASEPAFNTELRQIQASEPAFNNELRQIQASAPAFGSLPSLSAGQNQTVQNYGQLADSGLSGALINRPTFVDRPGYEAGGMIGPGGEPIRAGIAPQGSTQQAMQPQMLEMQIENFLNTRPQEVQQIQQAVMEALQTGELTQPELNQLSQLATTVLRNPAIYPQVRQFVINQGLASAQDIPEQFDEGLIFSIIVAARAANTATNGQNMMTGGSPQAAVNLQQPLPSMAQGGVVNGREDKPVDIRAHEGEYVVPKRVVEMKGREFFDKLLAQYKDDPDNG